MTVRYVGLGGNNANDGLSWANRKLTLNGVEDTPVVAGDTVYVGPGVYRELLTVDVSGAAGSPITYIGDVTGEHTDGVGGIVRITGSDNDQTIARSGINRNAKDYRTFSGLSISLCTYGVYGNGLNTTIKDCVFSYCSHGIYLTNTTRLNLTIQRCCFLSLSTNYGSNIYIEQYDFADDQNVLIENCQFYGGAYGIRIRKVGGITINNCTISCGSHGVWIEQALNAGQTVDVYNCLVFGCYQYAFQSATAGQLIEDYNAAWGNVADRSNVSTGANSNTYPPLFNPPILLDGFRMPWYFGELSKWSQLARIGGTGEATDDLFGITRPATSAKKSWGAIQATGAARETTTIDGVSGASIKLPDAGEQFLMRVPVTNASTVFTVKCYREADYAGTNPTFIVRQAGQADNTATDVGAASAWNTLTVTCTPAADPEWVDLFVVSYNTAVAGNYDCFFDTVTVT